MGSRTICAAPTSSLLASLAVVLAASGCNSRLPVFQTLSDAGPPAIGPATDLDTTEDHVCAIFEGRAYCWGSNASAQIGIADVAARGPVAVPIDQELDAIATGGSASCALARDGTVLCWGANQLGQLGDGTTEARAAPAPAVLPGPAASIALGQDHACAILASDRSLWCWGSNVESNLGLGPDSPAQVETPARVDEGRWREVSLGQAHGCGIREDGRLLCWGRNNVGQAAKPWADALQIRRPDPIDERLDWRSVDCGHSHTCAIGDDGAYCWGENSFELGISDEPARSAEITRVGPGDFVAIEAGLFTTCALRADGGAQCWGRNVEGQLSLAEAEVTAPAELSTADWDLLALGAFHSCGLRAGVAWCMGDNASGQLGTADVGRTSMPTRVLIEPRP
jgi:alpha-tubulin suppressor-like RCC1 family protein